jgi:hypothetical protein
MPEQPKTPVGEPPAKKSVKTDAKKPTGEEKTAKNPPEKPGDDEETMPIEEGFSIVP